MEKIEDNIPKGKVRKSKVHGKGLNSKENIKEGEILVLLTGQRLSWQAYKKMYAEGKKQAQTGKIWYDEWNALRKKRY